MNPARLIGAAVPMSLLVCSAVMSFAVIRKSRKKEARKMNIEDQYARLLDSVQGTMPDPQLWKDEFPELSAAIGWLLWAQDVAVHHAAQALRQSAQKMPKYTPPKSGTTGRIVTLSNADAIDPFTSHGDDCELCPPNIAIVFGQHWHRKRDGYMVPPAVLGTPSVPE